jgi:hypothetical protein
MYTKSILDPAAKSVLEHLKSNCEEEIKMIEECIKLRLHMSNGLTSDERERNLFDPFQLQLVIHDTYDLEMHAYDVGAWETQKQTLDTINQLLEYEVE